MCIVITPRQARFVFEYCKDFNATKAYVRAGYAEQGAGAGGSRLLENVEVQEAIEEQKALLARVATLSPEWILNQWMLIASANPADLVKVERDRCPGCWELSDANLPPNPACSRCKGRGEERVIVTETSKLKGAAKALYAGAVQTKDGIKILMRDQTSALDNLSKYMGMLVERRELSGPGGGPLAMKTVTAADLSDDQLAAIIAAGMTQNALSDGSEGVSLGVSLDNANATVIDAIA